MSINAEGKLEVAKWVSQWYIDQLSPEKKIEWDAHIAKWEGSDNPFSFFIARYGVHLSRQQCVQGLTESWDKFQDVFEFPTTPPYIIGHPLKRLARDLNFTGPGDFINMHYLVVPQGFKFNPKNGAIVLAMSLNNSGICSYQNSVALGVKHVVMTNGDIYSSIPGDNINTVDKFKLTWYNNYPIMEGHDISLDN